MQYTTISDRSLQLLITAYEQAVGRGWEEVARSRLERIGRLALTSDQRERLELALDGGVNPPVLMIGL